MLTYIRHHALTVNVSILMSIANREEMAVVVSAGEWLESDDKAGPRVGGTRIWRVRGSPGATVYRLSARKEPVGRLVTNFVLNSDNRFGSVTAGGFRSTNTITYFEGILLGNPSDATRRTATPIMSVQDFGDWMEENEARLGENSNEVGYDLRLWRVIARNGPSTAPLACLRTLWTEATFLSKQWDYEVIIALSVPPRKYWTAGGNIVFAPFGRVPYLEIVPGKDWLEEALPPVDMTYGGPLAEHALLLLSEVWRTDLATVKAGVEIPDEWVEIGVAPDRNEDDGPLFSKVMIARRPGAPVSECRSNRIPAPKTFRAPYNQHWVSPNAVLLDLDQ